MARSTARKRALNTLYEADEKGQDILSWEIMFNDDVPNMVAIDEALSLAKTLCDDDSPAFIHGLLSAVSADAEATEVAEQPTEPSAE